nr:hypothetical protein CFP56_62090 [Quercus suber]
MARHRYVLKQPLHLLVVGILTSPCLSQGTTSSPSWIYPPPSSDLAASVGTVRMSDTMILEWSPQSEMVPIEMSCLSKQGHSTNFIIATRAKTPFNYQFTETANKTDKYDTVMCYFVSQEMKLGETVRFRYDNTEGDGGPSSWQKDDADQSTVTMSTTTVNVMVTQFTTISMSATGATELGDIPTASPTDDTSSSTATTKVLKSHQLSSETPSSSSLPNSFPTGGTPASSGQAIPGSSSSVEPSINSSTSHSPTAPVSHTAVSAQSSGPSALTLGLSIGLTVPIVLLGLAAALTVQHRRRRQQQQRQAVPAEIVGQESERPVAKRESRWWRGFRWKRRTKVGSLEVTERHWDELYEDHVRAMRARGVKGYT